MSFELTTHCRFALPWERESDKIQEQETQDQPSTSKQRACQEHCVPTPRPVELPTQLQHRNPFPISVKSLNSFSSHALFPASIPHSAKQVRQGAPNQNSIKHANKPAPNTITYNLVQQIVQTVGELENTLLENQQTDFNLHVAYERQSEKLKNMCQSLENEKARNVRLMELIRGVDLSNSTEDEEPDNALSRCSATDRWSRSSELYESISPLLMQQRYAELCTSYKQCRRQLIKKEKLLKLSRCETETAKARYDNLLDEYQIAQKRFEQLCFRYLQLQARKNLEIHRLHDALNNASECIVNAQQLIECLDEETVTLYMNQNINNLVDDNECNNGSNTETNETDCITSFKQNLELFVKSIRLCQWIKQHSIAMQENNANQ